MNTFPKANSFDINLVRSKIMGPNPLSSAKSCFAALILRKGRAYATSDPAPASQA